MKKNRIIQLTVLLIAVSAITGSCKSKPSETTSADSKPFTTQRLIFNCDGFNLLGNYMFGERPLTLTDIHAYVDHFAQYPITTYIMTSGFHNLFYRSAYTRLIGEPWDGMPDRTFKDPHNAAKFGQNFLNVEREGADVITAVLQRARSHHLETFISYRMNDTHYNNPNETPLGYSDFWKNHPEYWTGETIGGWNTAYAFDFAHSEVRAFKIDIIAEQLDKYGHLIDGFELDFLRQPVYFKTAEGFKNTPLMTELILTVKQKVVETSKRTGRNILLSVRVPVNVEFCLRKGLDVKEWVRLGLVDMVSAGDNYHTNPAMPVEKFIHYLDNVQIPVYASIDAGGYRPYETFSHGQRRGIAAYAHAQGAAGIYLFNHQYLTSHLELLFEIGSPETLRKRNKIFAVDDGAERNLFGGNFTDVSLPMRVTAAVHSFSGLYIADNVLEDPPQEAILFLRINQPESLVVNVNETELGEQHPEYVTLFNRGKNLSGIETVYAYRVPVSVLKQGNNQISIISSGDAVQILRIEMAIRYGDETEYGYF